MEYLTQRSCADFTELQAAKTSVPGGGVAALAEALGAALCAMAGNFTVGKPRYASVEADVRSLLDRTEVLRLRFLELVDEDAAAFAPLARAYAIPAPPAATRWSPQLQAPARLPWKCWSAAPRCAPCWKRCWKRAARF